jgi:hypothetical protein
MVQDSRIISYHFTMNRDLSVPNAARLDSYMRNRDLIKGVQWLSALDERVCPVCIALDGLAWELPVSGDVHDCSGYFPIRHSKRFPGVLAHVGCRCTTVSVLKSFDELRGKKAWKFDAKSKNGFDDIFSHKLMAKGFDEPTAESIVAETRASMDGQVPVAAGFSGWLQSKSDNFQDHLLGEIAAALWRQRKIDLNDLTDDSNRLLTSDELTAKAVLRDRV